MATPIPGFTQITAASIQNALRQLLVAGTLEVLPTDGANHPITTVAGGAGGIIQEIPAPVTITNGTLPDGVFLPDVSLTKNAYISFRLTVKDADGEIIGVLKNVQPTGPTLNLDTYTPNNPVQAAFTAGPQGQTGRTGDTGPQGAAGITTYDGSNGPFYANGNLGGKSISGELQASGFVNKQQADPNMGFQTALAAAPQHGPVVITMDPAYTGNDDLSEFDYAENVATRSLAYPTNSRVSDRRQREVSLSFNMPGLNQGAHREFFYKGNTDPSQKSYHVHKQIDMFVGCGGSYHGQGNESVAINQSSYVTFAGAMISQNTSATVNKTGIGDMTIDETYAFYWGGTLNGDDECFKALSMEMREGDGRATSTDPGNLPVKVITGSYLGPDGVLLYTVNDGPNSSGNQLGAGRYAVRVADSAGADVALATLTVTGNNFDGGSYSTLTVAEAIPANMFCAAYGLSAPFTVPPNQAVAQQVTVAVAVQGGVRAVGFLPGIASMNGPRRNERVLVTAVTGDASSGSQTLTMMIRTDPGGISGGPKNYPQSQAYFFQDQRISADQPQTQGFSQSVLRFAAWSKGPGKYSQNIPVCAALDAHTLVYASNSTRGRMAIPGYDETIPLTIPGLKMGRSNGNLFFFYTFDQFTALYGGALTITGCSDQTFNVTGNLGQSGINYSGDQKLGFPNGGPDVGYDGNGNQDQNLLVTGNISVNLGANVIKLYAASEVTRLTDPSIENDKLGSRFGIESNDHTWVIGDVIEFPGHYSTGLVLSTRVLGSAQPSGSQASAGDTIIGYGPVIDGNFVYATWLNTNPGIQYKGMGGLRGTPTLNEIEGVFYTLFKWHQFTPGCRMFDLQALDVNNPASRGTFYEINTRNSQAILALDPYNDSVEMSQGNYGAGFRLQWRQSTRDGQNNTVSNSTVTMLSTLDLSGYAAINLKNAVNAQDAVTLSQMQAALPQGLTTVFNIPGNPAGSQNLHFTNGVLTQVN